MVKAPRSPTRDPETYHLALVHDGTENRVKAVCSTTQRARATHKMPNARLQSEQTYLAEVVGDVERSRVVPRVLEVYHLQGSSIARVVTKCKFSIRIAPFKVGI